MYRFPTSRARAVGACCVLVAGLAAAAASRAEDMPVRVLLDGRFEGPAALFVVPHARGYFKQEKLNVVIDAGSGSTGTVARVAAGAYDIGFADLAALMEFHANQPAAPNKPVAVMMVYNSTPAAVLALKKSGIRTPSDLNGRKLGAPLLDASRRAWPVFAQANQIEHVVWTATGAGRREAMLIDGEVDAITGLWFTLLLDLEARGVQTADIVVLPYHSHGVKLYGNAIVVGEAFLKQHPEAVKGFLRAFTKGVHDVVADPKSAITALKARDAQIDEAVELRRLQLALAATVLTADARAEGFGSVVAPRLNLMASQVSDALGTKERVNPNAVWNGSFLPGLTERNVFLARK